jgi:hypothetical protein
VRSESDPEYPIFVVAYMPPSLLPSHVLFPRFDPRRSLNLLLDVYLNYVSGEDGIDIFAMISGKEKLRTLLSSNPQ